MPPCGGIINLMEITKAKQRSLLVWLLTLLAVMTISAKTFFAMDAQETVFRYAVEEMDLCPAAACGIMANMEAESRFNPDISGYNGLGLCQWTGVRRSRLYTFCSNHNLDSYSAEGQIAFVQYELENYFPNVYDDLRSVSNDAGGAYDAAYSFCVRFEAPANASSMGSYRGRLARDNFWPDYGENAFYLRASSVKDGIALSWTGQVSDNQVVLRARKKNGIYEKIAVLSKRKRAYTDKTVRKGKNYYYYICTEREYKKYVRKEKDAPNRSNKCTVSADKSLKDEACSVKLRQKTFTYSGRDREPAVRVIYGKTRLKKGKDYRITYRNNRSAGKAVAEITGIGEYTGTVKCTFRINKTRWPVKAKIMRLKVSQKPAAPVLVSKKDYHPKYKLLSISDKKVAKIKNNRIVPRGEGKAVVKMKLYADQNHKKTLITFIVVVS